MSATGSPSTDVEDDLPGEPVDRDLRTHGGVQAANAESTGGLSEWEAELVADGVLDARRAHWLPTSELSEDERDAYIACEVEGVAPSDLATLPDVNRSASTIRTQLSRARRKIEEATQ